MSYKNLISGKKYRIIKEFTDYDKVVHPVGETWIFDKTTFTAYYDGLSMWVQQNGKTIMYRFQQLPYEQEELINTLSDYVEMINDDTV